MSLILLDYSGTIVASHDQDTVQNEIQCPRCMLKRVVIDQQYQVPRTKKDQPPQNHHHHYLIHKAHLSRRQLECIPVRWGQFPLERKLNLQCNRLGKHTVLRCRPARHPEVIHPEIPLEASTDLAFFINAPYRVAQRSNLMRSQNLLFLLCSTTSTSSTTSSSSIDSLIITIMVDKRLPPQAPQPSHCDPYP